MSLSVGEEDEHGVHPTAQYSEGLFGKRGVGHKQKKFSFFQIYNTHQNNDRPYHDRFTLWVLQKPSMN